MSAQTVSDPRMREQLLGQRGAFVISPDAIARAIEQPPRQTPAGSSSAGRPSLGAAFSSEKRKTP